MLKFCCSIVVLILMGCGTTAEITSAWVEPSIKDKDLQGVLVIAVTSKEQARISFESAYTAELQSKGVNAIASYTLVPGKAGKDQKNQLLTAAENAGLDTLLVSHYAGTIEEPVYHQGTTYYGVVPSYGGGYNHGRFGGYYGRVVEVGSTPDVWTMNKYVILVSDLYEVSTQEPLWQATSKTIKPDNKIELRDAFIKAFVGQMEEQGLLK